MTASKHSDPDRALRWPERLGFGASVFSVSSSMIVIGTFLTMYMTNVAMLDIAAVSVIIAVSKVLDGISDLIVGRIVDRTASRFGKARPWLLRMALPFALSLVLLFCIPSRWPEVWKYVYFFVMYNLSCTVLLTFLQVSQFSLMPLMTRNIGEHGILGVMNGLFSNIASVAANATFVRLLLVFSEEAESQTQRGYTATLTIFGAVTTLLFVASFLTTRERVREAPAKGQRETIASLRSSLKALVRNRNWVLLTVILFFQGIGFVMSMAGGSYFAMYYLGDMEKFPLLADSIFIPTLAVTPIIPFLLKKVGITRTFAAGQLALTAGFLGFGVFIRNEAALYIFNVLKGVGQGLFMGTVFGLFADCVTYSELKYKVPVAGLGGAGIAASQKIGQGLSSAIMGLILAGAGFDAALDAIGASQPPTVNPALVTIVVWLPFALHAACLAMFVLFFRLDKDMKELNPGYVSS